MPSKTVIGIFLYVITRLTMNYFQIKLFENGWIEAIVIGLVIAGVVKLSDVLWKLFR